MKKILGLNKPHLHLFYDKERIDEILSLYLSGASVEEISCYFKIGFEEINFIIDAYSCYL